MSEQDETITVLKSDILYLQNCRDIEMRDGDLAREMCRDWLDADSKKYADENGRESNE